ncbi:MAG: DUF63 family protein [Candidatus Diapherotrites archaeon]
MLDLSEIINEFFIRPVLDPSVQGYNIFNTLVYGALLLIISFYVLYPFLNKKGIQFNFKFFLALIPFILIGTTLRALNAAGLFNKTINPLDFGFYTFTPGVWLFTFFLVLIGLLIAFITAKKINKEFELILGVTGLIFFLPVLFIALPNFTQVMPFIYSLLLVLIIVIVSKYAIELFLKNFFKEKLNLTVLAGQAMDAGFTAYAITFCNYSEQHPVSDFILGIHPALFIAVKIALIAAILYFVDKEVEEKNLNGFIKVFLSILGFATGIASLVKLGLIGC